MADRAATLALFRAGALARASQRGIEHDWNLVSVAEEAEVNLFQYSRDAEMLSSIWVTFLSITRDHFPPDALKYTTLVDFLSVYPDFAHLPADEQRNLWQTANWMSVLFTMIPAAKNKGLVLAVIPQLIEGPGAKYITGSGQTEATAARVHIYEREGNIVVAHRSGGRSGARKKQQHTRGKQSTKKTPLRRRSDSLGSNSGGSAGGSRRPPRGDGSISASASAAAAGGGAGGMFPMMGHGHGHGHAFASESLPYARRPRSGTGSSSTDGEFRSGDEWHEEDASHYQYGDEDQDQDEGGDGSGNSSNNNINIHGSSGSSSSAFGGDTIEEEGDEEMADFADVLQMLRDTSASTRAAHHRAAAAGAGAGSSSSSSSGAGSGFASGSGSASGSGAGGMSLSLSAVAQLGSGASDGPSPLRDSWMGDLIVGSGSDSPGSLGLGLGLGLGGVPLERTNSWGGMVSAAEAGSDGPGPPAPLTRLSSVEFQNRSALPPQHPSYRGPGGGEGEDEFDLFAPLDSTAGRQS